MLDTICTRKEKIRVIYFFEIYKMMLIIFKSENDLIISRERVESLETQPRTNEAKITVL